MYFLLALCYSVTVLENHDYKILYEMSHLVRLWHFSSSVNSFFKRDTQSSNGAGCLIFGRTLHLFHTLCVNNEGSGQTAWMRRPAWALAGRLYDKYQNLMSRLKSFKINFSTGSIMMKHNNSVEWLVSHVKGLSKVGVLLLSYFSCLDISRYCLLIKNIHLSFNVFDV